MMSLFIESFFADLGFDSQLYESISEVTPCAKTMREIIFDSAADSILLERDKMASLPLTVLGDKGDGQKKCEGENFVKLVVKYNHDKEEVDVTCIGIGGSGNDSRSATESIDHSLANFDTISYRNKFDSQGTDAGGGGTREDLGRKLDGVGRVRDTIEYNISTCTLHAINLNLSTTTELTMGSGGLKNEQPSSASTPRTTYLYRTGERNGILSGS